MTEVLLLVVILLSVALFRLHRRVATLEAGIAAPPPPRVERRVEQPAGQAPGQRPLPVTPRPAPPPRP
ncbi:hypothetical protein QLH51_19380, partial [Sphingomonas sp. 2R-10]|nr:hypothetical protein [Sphingomonas sp. 2R-10]